MTRTSGLVAGALLAAGVLVALLMHEPPAPPVATPVTTATTPTTSTAPKAPTTPEVVFEPKPAEPRRPREPVVLRTLRGLVRDAATDTPIPRARVAARDPESGGAVLGAETDWEGRFSLEAPAGDLEVMAVAEGWLLPEPTLAPAATRDKDVIVRLEKGVPVRGRVTLAPGTQGWLPKRIEVCLVGPSARYVGSFEPLFAEPDGTFELPGAPLGPGHAVVASAPGYGKARVDLPPITGPVDGVVLELSQVIVVTGTVVRPDGQPAPNATVSARWPGESAGSTTTDGAGAFRLEAAWNDEFLLVATSPGFAGAGLTVGRRTALTGITLRLGAVCPVEATPFLDAQGKPLRAKLGCEPVQEDDPHARAPVDDAFEVELDASGRPLLDSLPPGRWSIHMLERASESEMRAWVLEVEVAPGPPLKLAFDGRAARGKVEGRVLGAPQDDLVQVEVRPATPPPSRGGVGFGFLAAVKAGPTGQFAVGDVPPGTYGVFASWEGGEARAEVEVREGGTSWVDVGP